MKKALFAILTVASAISLICSCTEDAATSPGTGATTAAKLLDLSGNEIDFYQRLDTIISYFPEYRVEVDTTAFTTLIDSAGNGFDFFYDSLKLAHLIITTNSVAVTGTYRLIQGHDSLFYYVTPPEVMRDNPARNSTLEVSLPPLNRSGSSQIISYLYLGFGYEVTRTYLGKQNVIVPAGGFNADVFQSDYTLPGSTEVVRTDLEYYAVGRGLVRIYSTGYFGSSHIYLIDSAVPAK